MTVYDELVHGAIDLHVHVDQEFSADLFRKVQPEWEWLPRAEAAGVRAVVLKSHLWPTTAVVPYLKQLYDGPVEVIPSISLNQMVGGIDPWAVEAAAQMGARVVFMPTWGAEADRLHGGFHSRLDASFEEFDPMRLSRLTMVDDTGKLTPAAHEVLRVCAEKELVLGTGHCGWQETLVLCREAKSIGFEKIIFNHPLSASVQASRESIVEAAAMGATVEFCWPNIAPGRASPADVVGLVQLIGASRVVLSSDFFGGNNPPPSDLLRLFLGTLLDAGLSPQDIKTATVDNPAALLDLRHQS